jgi:hypothetical protein
VAEASFEEWLLTERERLRELALEALARLLAHQSSGDDPAVAAQTARKCSPWTRSRSRCTGH